MSEVSQTAAGLSAEAQATVQSPPPVTVVERPVVDEKKELAQLAGEVAKRGSRKLLWEYLRLRSKVLGK